MGKRSLKASQAGITRAKQAFQRKGWTQEYLAAEVGLETRQSIWKFFSGRPIERYVFIDICFQLDLEWEDIVEPLKIEPLPEALEEPLVESWLEQARSKIHTVTRQQCGFLQTALDMAHPLTLEQVYTQARILPQPNHQQWLEVLDFENSSQFDRLQPRSTSQSITGLEAVAAHMKLMIFGKPGSGKTTFLQSLALRYSQEQEPFYLLPVYISLRHYAVNARKQADFHLESFISQQWSAYGLTQPQIETLLRQGKALVLLDGLDEVALADSTEVCAHIQMFAGTYGANPIVLTSRIAAQEYYFHGFTYVEMADFDDSQVATAVYKWFAATNPESVTTGLTKAEQFLEQLQRSENQPIRELVTTPLLLHLACLVFQSRSTFPDRHVRLYQAGLDILLVRWDSARGINRDSIYRDLTLPDKIKILSRIAAVMFEQGKLFFNKDEVIQVIAEYFSTLPTPCRDAETRWLKSEAVLRSIVLQNGLLVERARDVYSFSHLTFQEYLTARYLVASLATSNDPAFLKSASQHFTDPVWREVFLLTASLLPHADCLLNTLKQQIDDSLKNQLQLSSLRANYQNWSRSQPAQLLVQRTKTRLYHPTAIRAFYFSLIQDQNVSLSIRLDHQLLVDLGPELLLDLELTRIFSVGQSLEASVTETQFLNLYEALDVHQRFQMPLVLGQSIRSLQAQFPVGKSGQLQLGWLDWWQDQGQNWLMDLGKALLDLWQEQEQNWLMELHHCLKQYRNMMENSHSKQQQRLRLQQYCRAHKFLLDCFQDDHRFTETYRQQLEATLLLAGGESSIDNMQVANDPSPTILLTPP